MSQEQIAGKVVTRNWMVNLMGQVFPLLVGLLTIPRLLRDLGMERFGILSIIWALLGYAGQLDLGLGRATTKYVAEYLGSGDIRRLPGIFWTSLVLQVAFAAVAALLFSAAIPFLVHWLLKRSPLQTVEVRNVLLILACSLPIVVASNSLRGMLEAGQHFTAVNLIKTPANISVFLLPILAMPLGTGLPSITLLLVAGRLAAALAFVGCCLRFFPVLRSRFVFDGESAGTLFVYGGWITVSNLIGPFLTYVDRIFVGAMLSMSAVGYYTAPYEIVTKLSLLPSSLLATVFPAFSSLHGSNSPKQIESVYMHSLKSILLVSGPVLLIFAAFAKEILTTWLGPDFGARSTGVLQILGLGVLINGISFLPFGLLQGLGRPDLTAKFHLLELPFYIMGLWLLVPHFGLKGVAWAWTLRVILDTLLLFGAVVKLNFVSPRAMVARPMQKTFAALALPGMLLPLSWIGTPPGYQAATAALSLLLFAGVSWSYVLDHQERCLLLSLMGLHPRLADVK